MNQNPEAGDEKDLLDELMGTKSASGPISHADVQLPDGPLPAVPDPNRELDVKPAAPKSRVASLDEQHATSAGGEGYALTITGQAYTFDGRVKVNRDYKVVVNVKQLEGALATLRKIPKNGGESYLDPYRPSAQSRWHKNFYPVYHKVNPIHAAVF